MRWRERVVQWSELLVLVVAGVIVLGHVLGQPALLSYVTTGSMTGTINPGEGFVAIPIQVAGPVHVGDIVTYKAQVLHHGKLTTHRVVDVRNGGFVTKGDANLVTDQDAGEPVVQRRQVVSKALQIGGHVVVIPFLGVLVNTARGGFQVVYRALTGVIGAQTLSPSDLEILVLLVVGVAYALGGHSENRRRTRSMRRERGLDGRLVVTLLALVVVASVTVGSLAASGPARVPMDSVAASNANNGGVVAGTDTTRNFSVSNGGIVPVIEIVSPVSRGVRISRRSVILGPRSRAQIPATFHAPSKPGRYYRRILVSQYPMVLPPPVYRFLYYVHPLAPLALDDCLLGGLVLVGGRLVAGRSRMRSRTRDDGKSTTDRVRRWIRNVAR